MQWVPIWIRGFLYREKPGRSYHQEIEKILLLSQNLFLCPHSANQIRNEPRKKKTRKKETHSCFACFAKQQPNSSFEESNISHLPESTLRYVYVARRILIKHFFSLHLLNMEEFFFSLILPQNKIGNEFVVHSMLLICLQDQVILLRGNNNATHHIWNW